MRATRGLLASLGAGLSLILAGSVALTLVSALIAFNGWPGAEIQRTADEQALVAEVAAPQTVRRVAQTVPLEVPRAPVRERAADRSAAQRRTAAAKVAGAERAHTTAAVAHAATEPAAADSVPETATGPGATKPPGAVETLKRKVTVAPAGETVRRLGTALDKTVGATGETVAHLVGPALPAVAPVVTGATDAVGALLNHVTIAVGQLLDNLTKQAAALTMPSVPPALIPPQP